MVDIETIAIKKISPAETLKSIPIGETRVIRDSKIKQNTVRSTISRLKKQGYNFISKNSIDGTIVTRTE